MSFSGGSSRSRDRTCISSIGWRILYRRAPRKLHFPLRFISVAVFMTQVLPVCPQTLRVLGRASGRTQHELGTLGLKAFSWPLLGQLRWACS